MPESSRFFHALLACAALAWAQPAIADTATTELTAKSGSTTLRISMPAAGWNGALVEVRCGSDCAQPPEAVCNAVVQRGYACFANAPATISGAHESLLAARASVAAHAGAAVQSNVLLACSAGAGSALWQAEQFPEDFQGIVAGAPILDDSAYRLRQRWFADTLRAPGGGALLKPADLARVHAAALASCDANDGVADGLISDPLRCTVRTDALQCPQAGAGAAGAATCLTPAQIDAVRRLYAGPSGDSSAGLMPGSELGWSSSAKSIRRRAPASAPRERAQPELQRFAAAGGKLLLFQGLADVQVAPRQTAETYERWAMALGGRVKSTAHLRLFMVPGLQHCGGGDGPYQIDFLRGIENWVVKAKRAPDDFIAFHPRTESAGMVNLFAPTALDPAQQVFSSWQVGVTTTLPESRNQPQTRFSRPIYLYPVHTHYKGMGDPDIWRSFYGPNDYPWLLK